MPDLITHIGQAVHNERCARFILGQNSDYRDWAITAAFYAAVHLVEACFTTKPDIGHTESARDRGKTEQHRYRSNKINELAQPAYASYRKLHIASQRLRYLAMRSPHIATDFYSVDDARQLIEGELPKVQQELEKAFGINLS